MIYVPKDKLKIFDKNTRVKISNHAEEVALKKADPKKLNGAKLYIIRAALETEFCDESPIFMNSKPCKRCTQIIESCIKRFGLKAVYYRHGYSTVFLKIIFFYFYNLSIIYCIILFLYILKIIKSRRIPIPSLL